MIFGKRTKDVSRLPVEKFANGETTNMIVNGKIQRVQVLVKKKDNPIVVKTENSTYIIDRDCNVKEATITSEINNIVSNNDYPNGVSEFIDGVAEIILNEDGKNHKALLSYGNFGIYSVGKSTNYEKKSVETGEFNKQSEDESIIDTLKVVARSAYLDPFKFKQIAVPLSIVDKQAAFFALDVAYSRFLDEAENIKSEFTGEIGAENMKDSADIYITSVIKDIISAEDMKNNGMAYSEIYDLIKTCGVEAFDPDLTVAACFADIMLSDNPSISTQKADAYKYDLYLKQIKNKNRAPEKEELEIITNKFIDSDILMLQRIKSVLRFLPQSFETAKQQIKRLVGENIEFANLLNSYLNKESKTIELTNKSASRLIEKLNSIKKDFDNLSKEASQILG